MASDTEGAMVNSSWDTETKSDVCVKIILLGDSAVGKSK